MARALWSFHVSWVPYSFYGLELYKLCLCVGNWAKHWSRRRKRTQQGKGLLQHKRKSQKWEPLLFSPVTIILEKEELINQIYYYVKNLAFIQSKMEKTGDQNYWFGDQILYCSTFWYWHDTIIKSKAKLSYLNICFVKTLLYSW